MSTTTPVLEGNAWDWIPNADVAPICHRKPCRCAVDREAHVHVFEYDGALPIHGHLVEDTKAWAVHLVAVGDAPWAPEVRVLRTTQDSIERVFLDDPDALGSALAKAERLRDKLNRRAR